MHAICKRAKETLITLSRCIRVNKELGHLGLWSGGLFVFDGSLRTRHNMMEIKTHAFTHAMHGTSMRTSTPSLPFSARVRVHSVSIQLSICLYSLWLFLSSSIAERKVSRVRWLCPSVNLASPSRNGASRTLSFQYNCWAQVCAVC